MLTYAYLVQIGKNEGENNFILERGWIRHILKHGNVTYPPLPDLQNTPELRGSRVFQIILPVLPNIDPCMGRKIVETLSKLSLITAHNYARHKAMVTCCF